MRSRLITVEFIIVLLFLTSCRPHAVSRPIEAIRQNSVKVLPRDAPKKTTVDQQKTALLAFKSDLKLSPGTVRLLEFPYYGPFNHEELRCNGASIPFVPVHGNARARAYISLSYFSADHHVVCSFSFDQGEKKLSLPIQGIHVVVKQYPEEELRVDKKRVHLSKPDEERLKRETEILKRVYEQSAKTLLFDTPFSAPLRSKITTMFGTRRLFNKSKRGEHLGTDFRAPIGTPIKSANSGRVAFVGDHFLSGNTVIVDHGLGIFTVYGHLSKILVNVGDKVSKTTLLGLSGNTGRVSGPHLHWGVKIHGNWVDGFSLMEASELAYKNAKNEANVISSVQREQK